MILAVWFGLAFRYNYDAATSEPSEGSSEIASAPSAPPGTNTESPNTDLTNAIGNTTNALTNLATQTTNAPGDVTNAASAGTNVATAEIATNAPDAKHKRKVMRNLTPTETASAKSAMIGYLRRFDCGPDRVGIAHHVRCDSSRRLPGDGLFAHGRRRRDARPNVEEAEALWANAKYLEAIQLLREYLKKNPREMHAALRIAEIYEKDLRNYLAAGSEYEEVLKHKFARREVGLVRDSSLQSLFQVESTGRHWRSCTASSGEYADRRARQKSAGSPGHAGTGRRTAIRRIR